MQTIEREILRKLIEVAEKRALKLVRFAAQPGCREDAILNPTLGEAWQFAKDHDANSIAEFETITGQYHFWVLLVWGNGEDVISDYLLTREADLVVNEVYSWLEV